MLITVNLRRYDLSDCSRTEVAKIEVSEKADYHSLISDIKDQLGLQNDNFIIKLRNIKENIIPLSSLVQNDNPSTFTLDVTKPHQCVPANERNKVLQESYVIAVDQKLQSLKRRVKHAEQLLPQFQHRWEAQMEETVQHLVTKMSFLLKCLERHESTIK